MKKLNKKAQGTILFSILIAVMLFFVGMLAISFIEDAITGARTDNSCSAPLTDGGKLLCLLFDGVIPYYFLAIVSIVGGAIISKFV